VATKTIGLIGGGNMGEALLRGLLAARLVPPGSVLVSEPDRARRERLVRGLRVRAARGNAELARAADVVVLAVKPALVAAVLAEIAPAVSRRTLLVSVAAGVTLDAVAAALGAPARLVRAMPNTPALVGAGATAVAWGPRVSAADRRLVLRLFGAAGRVAEVPEPLLDAVTGLSGSGPAYVFTVIQALADGGVREGLPRAVALELAAQTVFGAAKMVLETGASPVALRDQVASPGGTTIRGIAVLDERGVAGALMAAVEAAARRSRELSRA